MAPIFNIDVLRNTSQSTEMSEKLHEAIVEGSVSVQLLEEAVEALGEEVQIDYNSGTLEKDVHTLMALMYLLDGTDEFDEVLDEAVDEEYVKRMYSNVYKSNMLPKPMDDKEAIYFDHISYVYDEKTVPVTHDEVLVFSIYRYDNQGKGLIIDDASLDKVPHCVYYMALLANDFSA